MKKIKSLESVLTFHDDVVIKTFTKEYFQINEKLERHGEVFWYENLRGTCFLEPLETHETHIVLPLIGKPVGDDLGLDNLTRREAILLINWLTKLRGELERNSVVHHDIHPGNILRDGDDYKLIDMAWMQWSHEPTRCLDYMNLEYSLNDDRSIMQLFCQLERMLKS